MACFSQPNSLRITATWLDVVPGSCGGDSVQKQCFKRSSRQAGSSPVRDHFLSWLLGISGSQTAQASQGTGCCLSAHMPSPGSADSCICPSGSDLLGHDAGGSLLLPGATSFPGEVSEPGKGRDGRGTAEVLTASLSILRRKWPEERISSLLSHPTVSHGPWQRPSNCWPWISLSCFKRLGLLLLLASPGLCLLPRLVQRAPKAGSAQGPRAFPEQGNAQRQL